MDNQQSKINELEEKIELLETRQAFQEDTIETLNNAIILHQKEVEQLKLTINNLLERVSQSSNSLSDVQIEEPPPHY